jgi:hypothetical protein
MIISIQQKRYRYLAEVKGDFIADRMKQLNTPIEYNEGKKLDIDDSMINAGH